ncbi:MULTISPECIES: type I pantothenate kinase [unclassified Enterococcus]|uniref:type I pantothenate kinase n=1 Tax=unclassified Enterococcus TaxID=2608891 RepID=UPI001552A83B|nr:MULTISPECIES: type I pantothenate kinase [unclassified Enterococcus]MBS7576136.1 type I pantothenate kinase [Enterococcus sp. MMGLQ5-2]MBS7583369.1 type I pantothenate kinase [Enterococcus sp. MMGLQ5-1]NPD11229.1 type I pantothenate kinase [Enterococcus sp. MMGLQ5-1]NPD35972.1 type I pantothenate kinase [Enterococcus sp. MMGLQ5-2]
MDELINFEKISRDAWRALYHKTIAPLSIEELENIKSLNDAISLEDVQEIYLPLIHLIRLYKKTYEDLNFSKGLFLQKFEPNRPFIIGIAGSVAVGKSTTARLLQILLTRYFKNLTVDLVTTDGFLYPNKELRDRGILDRKGFPESYNMDLLLTFLDQLKSGKKRIESPVYSHEVYDILKDEKQILTQPDIVIVEGINVFQNPNNQHLYVSDFFDFSIYVDAEENLIYNWYIERFKLILELAKDDPQNYYHEVAKWPLKNAIALATDTWNTINKINLMEYILPTRNRADIILHKSQKHYIDAIYLKKF